jgi:hypothetical protein
MSKRPKRSDFKIGEPVTDAEVAARRDEILNAFVREQIEKQRWEDWRMADDKWKWKNVDSR